MSLGNVLFDGFCGREKRETKRTPKTDGSHPKSIHQKVPSAICLGRSLIVGETNYLVTCFRGAEVKMYPLNFLLPIFLLPHIKVGITRHPPEMYVTEKMIQGGRREFDGHEEEGNNPIEETKATTTR